MSYAHEQLWALAQSWYGMSDDEVDAGAALAYRHCADQLGDLLGPLAFAVGVGGDEGESKP